MNPDTTLPRDEGAVPIEWAGQQIILLPERAVHWPARQTVCIADLHIGKAETFHAAGIAVPSTFHHDLRTLDLVLNRTRARRLVVLGDFAHGPAAASDQVLKPLRQWLARHPELEIHVVRGNHDTQLADLPLDRLCYHDEPWSVPPLAARHHPEPVHPGEPPALAGHWHPGLRLRERGRSALRCPCFVVTPLRLVLPAFSRFTGTAAIPPRFPDASIYLVGPGHIHPSPIPRSASTRRRRASPPDTG